jgi:hypothetical protein
VSRSRVGGRPPSASSISTHHSPISRKDNARSRIVLRRRISFARPSRSDVTMMSLGSSAECDGSIPLIAPQTTNPLGLHHARQVQRRNCRGSPNNVALASHFEAGLSSCVRSRMVLAHGVLLAVEMSSRRLPRGRNSNGGTDPSDISERLHHFGQKTRRFPGKRRGCAISHFVVS